MVDINSIPATIPAQGGMIPLSVRQRMLADQLLSQKGSDTSPVYHYPAAIARAAAGALGGLMEGHEASRLEANQRAAAASLAIPENGSGGGGGAAPAGGAGASDPNGIVNMVRAAAAKYGVNPDVAVKVLGVESSNGAAYYGDKGPDGKPSSFGPLQLHYGGINPNMPHGGMGDDFTRATGLDARDPNTIPQQIDFAMSQVPKTGWAPWATTRDKLGLTNWSGVTGSQVAQAGGSAPPPAQTAAQPAAKVAPSAADMPVKTAENDSVLLPVTPGTGGFAVPGLAPSPYGDLSGAAPKNPYGDLSAAAPKSPYGDLSNAAAKPPFGDLSGVGNLSPSEMTTLKEAMGPQSAPPNPADQATPPLPPPAAMAAQFAPVSNALSAAAQPITLDSGAGGPSAALGPGDAGPPAPAAPPLPPVSAPPVAAPAPGPQGPLAGDFGQMSGDAGVTPEMLAAAAHGLINVPPTDTGPIALDGGLGGQGAPVGPGDVGSAPPQRPTDLASALAMARKVPVSGDVTSSAVPAKDFGPIALDSGVGGSGAPVGPGDIGASGPTDLASALAAARKTPVQGDITTSPAYGGMPTPPAGPTGYAYLGMPAPPAGPTGAAPAPAAPAPAPMPVGTSVADADGMFPPAALAPQGAALPPDALAAGLAAERSVPVPDAVAANVPVPPVRPANLGVPPPVAPANARAPGATNAGPAVIPAPLPPAGSNPQALAARLAGPTMTGRNNNSVQTPTQFNVAQAASAPPQPGFPALARTGATGKPGLRAALAAGLGGATAQAPAPVPANEPDSGPLASLGRALGFEKPPGMPIQAAAQTTAPTPSGAYNPYANVQNDVIHAYNALVTNPYATPEQIKVAQDRIAQYMPQVLPDGRVVTRDNSGVHVSALPVAHEVMMGRDGQPPVWKDTGQVVSGAPDASTFEARKALSQEEGKAAADREKDMMAAANQAPEAMGRLKLLQSVLGHTHTGAFAPEVGTAVAFGKFIGLTDDQIKATGLDPNQATNNEVANKLASELTVGAIGSKNGGFPASNFSVAEREFIQKMFPNAENQPGANAAVSDILMAREQRKMDVATEWNQFQDAAHQAGKFADYREFESKYRGDHKGENPFQGVIDKYNTGAYTGGVAPPPLDLSGKAVPMSASPAATGGAAPAAQAQPQPAAAAAPQAPATTPMPIDQAQTMLKANPSSQMRAHYDAVYGAGASAKVLGQ